jgi:hypothetical protein
MKKTINKETNIKIKGKKFGNYVRGFIFNHVHVDSGAHSFFSTMGTEVSFLGNKAAGALS